MSKKDKNIYKGKDGRKECKYIKKKNYNGQNVYRYLYLNKHFEAKSKIKNIDYIFSQNKKIYNPLKFSSIIGSWLNNIKFHVKESTFAHYHTVIKNHLLPHLGECRISEINDDYMERYVKELVSSGLSNKTINDILTLLKSVIKYAKSKNIMLSCNLNNLSVKNTKCEAKTLTVQEQKKLTAFLISNINYKNLGILLSLYTGIRIGEVCALCWSDINMDEKIILINKTMLRIKNSFYETDEVSEKKTKVIISTPKTVCSVRNIPIPDFLFSIIKEMYANNNSYILTNQIDKYIEPRTMQYYFKKILKQCSIDDVKFHSLRHTFATRCIECGFDIKTLSEILGHSSTRITLDRYVHSSMDFKRINMGKLSLISA